jgi:hypothetical protein
MRYERYIKREKSEQLWRERRVSRRGEGTRGRGEYVLNDIARFAPR